MPVRQPVRWSNGGFRQGGLDESAGDDGDPRRFAGGEPYPVPQGRRTCWPDQKLRTPSTAEELARAMNITDVGLLRELLDVGVAVGELRSRDGRYS